MWLRPSPAYGRKSNGQLARRAGISPTAHASFLSTAMGIYMQRPAHERNVVGRDDQGRPPPPTPRTPTYSASTASCAIGGSRARCTRSHGYEESAAAVSLALFDFQRSLASANRGCASRGIMSSAGCVTITPSKSISTERWPPMPSRAAKACAKPGCGARLRSSMAQAPSSVAGGASNVL